MIVSILDPLVEIICPKSDLFIFDFVKFLEQILIPSLVLNDLTEKSLSPFDRLDVVEASVVLSSN